MAKCHMCQNESIPGTPYCLDCTVELSNKLRECYGEKYALWIICALYNIPYKSEFVNNGRISIIKYRKKLQDNNIEGDIFDSDKFLFDLPLSGKANKSESNNTELDELRTENELLRKRVEILEKENEELSQVATGEVSYDQNVLMWGEDYSDEEYMLLNDIFAQYTNQIDNLTPPMRFRYQDLAKLELRRRQLGNNADPKESKTIADEINNLYKILHIENFESSQKTDEQRLIDKICWEIENTTPAELEDLKVYQDFSGYDEPMRELYRCMFNAAFESKEYPNIGGMTDGSNVSG